MSTLALALSLALGAADGLAPSGPGHPAEGTQVDLVVRAPASIAPGRPTPLRILLSDAATDVPVDRAAFELRFFGPKGTPPIETPVTPGALPGHYLAQVTFPRPGRYALAASVDRDWLATNGFEVAVARAGAPSRPFWPWLLGAAVLLALLAFFRRSVRPAAAAALLATLAAGDAAAHQALTPKAAAIPGANVYVPQEIQFALAIRTLPAKVESFPPPAGSSDAPRQFLGVPRSAIVDREGKKLIFVRMGPERFVAREPKLGWEKLGPDGAWVAVLGGLQIDERVVVAGAAFLRNGGATPPAGEEDGSAGRRAEAEGSGIRDGGAP